MYYLWCFLRHIFKLFRSSKLPALGLLLESSWVVHHYFLFAKDRLKFSFWVLHIIVISNFRTMVLDLILVLGHTDMVQDNWVKLKYRITWTCDWTWDSPLFLISYCGTSLWTVVKSVKSSQCALCSTLTLTSKSVISKYYLVTTAYPGTFKVSVEKHPGNLFVSSFIHLSQTMFYFSPVDFLKCIIHHVF